MRLENFERETIEAHIRETAEQEFGTFILTLFGERLDGYNYSRLHLPYSQFRASQLTGMTLALARLNCAVFDDTLLSVCILDGAILQEATAFRAHFLRSSLVHTQAVRATLYAARLTDCLCDGINLNGASLEQARLAGCSFGQVKDTETGNLISSDFRGANLRGVTVQNCTFDYASFAGAHLHGASFLNCSLKYTSFIGAILEGTQFRGCGLNEPHLHHTIWDRK